jgi:hypothetical protein
MPLCHRGVDNEEKLTLQLVFYFKPPRGFAVLETDSNLWGGVR